MFSVLILCSLLYGIEYSEGVEKSNTIGFPLPIDLPYRNERSEQCWLRIEDVEITETLTVYCTFAEAFLGYYIHDYNIKKMTEDAVDVSLWIEKPRNTKDGAYGPPEVTNGIKDWRVTTVMDPITQRRIYVTKSAACRLIMYNREGMTNYVVDCPTLLYFFNEHNAAAVFSKGHFLLAICIFLLRFVL